MLEIEKCCLVVIDVQGRLAQLVDGREELFKNIRILIEACKLLTVPIIWCQQCPKALGPTVPEIAELLTCIEPIDKAAFSCCGAESFNKRLNSLKRSQFLLCGIESHVCVYQTAMDLLDVGKEVHVVSDAVSSRTASNKQTAIEKMRDKGADISSVETVVFELLRTAEHPHFKAIAGLIK
jgi:nicotinamidase-related amidase